MSSIGQPVTTISVPSVSQASDSWFLLATDRMRCFLLRRRVFLTMALFWSLVFKDLFCGVKPHDVLDWTDSSTLAGLALLSAGVILRSWAAGVLCKGTMLTRTGPYSLIRNPLYVGSFLMMFGFCKLLGDAEKICVVAGPMLWLYLVKIRDEEQGLAEQFPAEWKQYAAATPRFFPRRISAAVCRDWNLSQWLGGREYRAVVGTLMTLIALKVWRIL